MEQAEKKGMVFTIEESFYKERVEPIIDKKFTPVSLIHFAFSLPFQFPVKNGTLFYLVYGDKAHFFHLDKFGDNRKEPLFAGENGINHPKMRTRVESLIVSRDSFSNLDYEGIHSHLVHSLNKLNSFLNAYRILFEDWKTRPVTPENLNSVIWHRTIDVQGWSLIANQPLLVNENYSNIITNLSDEFTEYVHNCGAYLANGKNPFAVPRSHFADARTHLCNGFFKESILSSQMAVESTIRLIYQNILETKGLKDSDVQNLLEKTPFMKLVKSEMPNILGGKWDTSDAKSFVGKWYQILYKKRNAIIHAGYVPYGHEAYECFVIAYSFLTQINMLIADKKGAHPNLFDLCAGFPPYFLQGQEIGNFGID